MIRIESYSIYTYLERTPVCLGDESRNPKKVGKEENYLEII